MALISEMGANTVRMMAHYQHAPEWYAEADKAGMLVWAEIPFIGAASLDGSPASAELTANARQQLKELIRQQYNHPSIFLWSVGNEVDASGFMPGSKAPKPLSLLKNLNQLAHDEDPSRLTTFADCCEDAASLSPRAPAMEALARTTDVIGYNRYYGWYIGKPADVGSAIDTLHAKHPSLPLSISEYGAGAALSQHSDNPEGGVISPFGRQHPEEYQSWLHEQTWAALKDRSYIFASWVWNMFDFASDLRQEGDSTDLNDKGLVSFDRRVKKDAFFFYKAQWSDQPTLHLTGSRYTDRNYSVTDIKAYSNASSAELTINGLALGSTPCHSGICVWPNVRLNSGANHVVVAATVGGMTLVDSADWTAPDANAGVNIDAGAIVGHITASGSRFGSDNFFKGGTARLVDDKSSGSAPILPVKDVQNASAGLSDRTYREGDFEYDIPIADGKWLVTVHSFEPDASIIGTRNFDVVANGRTQVSMVVPRREGAGAPTVVAGRFIADAIEGRLTLKFIGSHGAAIVSDVEIVRPSSRARTINIK